MPGLVNLKPALIRIWNAPDNFRIMDPLPSLHRKGIIIAALVMITGFLWPVTPSSSPQTQPSQPVPLQETAPAPQTQVPAQSESVVAPPTDSAGAAPVAPSEQAPAPYQNNDIEQQWRSYRVDSGKTLAQLFRDHGLPAEDVYAMAKIEGDGKPLSNLQSGQMVKIRQNANGVVTGLTITHEKSAEVLFTRQPDGSFLRVR